VSADRCRAPLNLFRAAAACVLLGLATAGCGATPTAAAQPPAPPPTSRVGYDRLQQAYSLWQLLDRSREATSRLQTWRELDPESGSAWEYAPPNRTHYRVVAPDGQVYEGYEVDETDCWRRGDGSWDRRPIGRRPPAAGPALADDLFSGAWRVINEGNAEADGTPVQVVRFSQRAGDRRWSTLARDREVRLWLAVEDGLPRRFEIAVPSFRAPEQWSLRVLSQFDAPREIESPCS
jgi:hypothetical protein